MRQGIIVVAPYPTDPCPDSAYRGFDGEFWPGMPAESDLVDACLLPFAGLSQAIAYAESIRGNYKNIRLIAIAIDKPSAEFCFVGYDAGILIDSTNHFSFILNDILNPKGAFVSHSKELNESRLFNSFKDVDEFIKLRTEYKGRDIESFGQDYPVCVLPIWLYQK